MKNTFFVQELPRLTLADVAEITGAQLSDDARSKTRVSGLAVLGDAGPTHVTFLDNLKYLPQLAHSHAAACFVSKRFEARLPPHITALRTPNPYSAFVTLARKMYPRALRPTTAFQETGIASTAVVHPTARLEDDVCVDPLAIIGPDAEIGAGSLVGAGAVIGAGVKIGRSCAIGAHTTIACSLIGNNVIIHPGCRIGQDGYGFLPAADSHVKVPQTGRVIIQNDVEIGANTTIDRGALRDTVIGEGTKIDNLVQIAHNVTVGRRCLITSQVGIAGSATLGEGVALGARAGVNNHVVIGDGAQIAATSIVHGDVPKGARWGGTPAKPMKIWFREVMLLERMARAAPAGDPERQSEA